MLTINFNYLVKFMLNYIFISIPQAIILVVLVLFLLKEHSYFKEKNFKTTLLKVLFIAGIQSAFFTNYLLYFTDLNLLNRAILNSIIFLFFITIFLKSTLKEYHWKEHLNAYSPDNSNKKLLEKTFKVETKKYTFIIKNNIPKLKYKNIKNIYFSIVLILILNYIFELSSIFYLQYFFNIDLATLTSNLIDTILIVHPGSLILTFCIYLSYVYVNTGDVTIFKIWIHNKNFRIITYIQVITTFTFSLLIYVFIIKDNLFNISDANLLFKIAMILYNLLILHILIPWGFILRKEMLQYKLNSLNKLR